LRSKLQIILLIIILQVFGCVKLPLTKPIYNGEDAAEIVVIRLKKISGSGAGMYVRVDSKAVCLLQVGEYTKFPLKPGTYTFEAVYDVGRHRTIASTFEIKPNRTYYFRPNNSYWGTLYFFEISEIEARNLMVQKDRYKYKTIEQIYEGR
jgi:hypothetical protein